MTSQQQLVCDLSTLANFKEWASAISAFFAAAGWIQHTDTGQVNWTSIASVPTSGNYVYEIWKPGDALTVFYVKIEYGNRSNTCTMRLTLGTSTNGAGTITGQKTAIWDTNYASATVPSTTTKYECNFSGSTSRISAMMWRNAPSPNQFGPQMLFAIERGVDSSGAYIGTHATLIVAGAAGSDPTVAQQSLLFAVGAPPTADRTITNGAGCPLSVRTVNLYGSSAISSSFNGSIPFDTVSPNIGYFDFPLTVIGVAVAVDIVDGVTFQTTIYGATRTYMPGKLGAFGWAICTSPVNALLSALCMRYD